MSDKSNWLAEAGSSGWVRSGCEALESLAF